MIVAPDRIIGTLLGTAIGDALGMPIEGLSHQNVRTYYKGIKTYRADEKRGELEAGQWTDDTQLTFAVAQALTRGTDTPETLRARLAEIYIALLPEARRWGPTTKGAVERLAAGEDLGAVASSEAEPTNGAAMRAAPLGAWWAVTGASRSAAWTLIHAVLSLTHAHPASLAAGFGQAFAVREAIQTSPEAFDRDAFWTSLVEMVHWAEGHLGSDHTVSSRLDRLMPHLDDWPLDLQDLCNGTGYMADESWPFSVAMFARNPGLTEASILSAINVGGDADTIGALVGALVGAHNGWASFPDEWKEGLEACESLVEQATLFAEALRNHA